VTVAGLVLRRAGVEDSEAIWGWRNDPAARAVSVHTGEVPWEDHVRWFASVLTDPDRYLLVGEVGGALVGVVRFDRLTADSAARWEVSINLAPDARGHGLAVPLLDAGREWLAAREGDVSVLALVRADNAASQRTFRGAGYAEESSTEGWTTLVWTPATRPVSG
jgi:RimJ/RimL family protein N-acetyltransferase